MPRAGGFCAPALVPITIATSEAAAATARIRLSVDDIVRSLLEVWWLVISGPWSVVRGWRQPPTTNHQPRTKSEREPQRQLCLPLRVRRENLPEVARQRVG